MNPRIKTKKNRQILKEESKKRSRTNLTQPCQMN